MCFHNFHFLSQLKYKVFVYCSLAYWDGFFLKAFGWCSEAKSNWFGVSTKCSSDQVH